MVALILDRIDKTTTLALGATALLGTALPVGSFVVAPLDGWWLVLGVAIGGLIVATVATWAFPVVDRDGRRQRRRWGLAVGAASVAGYGLLFLPALLVSMPVGVMSLEMAGGEIGADGLPVVSAGALLGLVTAAAHLLARAIRLVPDSSRSPDAVRG